MNILTFRNFSKRSNSTKIPSDCDGVSKSVVLKDGTSKYNPVFSLNSNDDSITYVKAFGLYYFVNDLVHVRQNVLEVHCSIDVMASYRSQILNSTAYVIFSSSNYNSNIIDSRLSSNKNSIVNYSTLSLFTVATNYIVNYVSTAGSSIVFSSEEEFEKLITAINNTDFLDSILANPTDYFSKLYNSVTDCIKSAFSVPISIEKGAVKEPVLGRDYIVNATGNAVPNLSTWSGSITIPWQFTDFRNRSQFTSLILYLPGYGMIELNADDYNGKTSISISASLSNLSGDLIYKVGNTSVCKCNIATPIQIGNISSNGLGAISSAVASGLNYASGNEFGAIMSGFNAVTSLMSRSVGSVGINGGFSSFAIEPKIVLYAISHDTNVEPNNLVSTGGRPLNEQVSLSSLNGYCQTVNANVSAPTSEENINRINSIMNGGFFIE